MSAPNDASSLTQRRKSRVLFADRVRKETAFRNGLQIFVDLEYNSLQRGAIQYTPYYTSTTGTLVTTPAERDAYIASVPTLVPGAPTITGVTGGVAQATVFFTPSTRKITDPVTSYIVRSYPDDIQRGTGTSSPITVTGLTDIPPTYRFRVYARNANGTSDPSAPSDSITLATAPDAPTELLGSSFSSSVTIDFTPGYDGASSILNYEYSINGESYIPFSPATGAVSSVTITGLTTGQIYNFRLRAVNVIGSSDSSDLIYITPLSVSGAQLLLDGAVNAGANIWYDSSGKNRNCSIVGVPNWSSANGGNYIFDGSGKFVSAPSGFSDFSSGVTILAFVNFVAVNNWERILDFGNGAESNNILFSRQGTTNNLQFEIYSGGSSTANVLTNGVRDNWGFYAARANGSTFMVKNQYQTNSTASSVLPTNIFRNNNYIGKSNWSLDSNFGGSMGIVGVFNTALSDADISGFFNLYKYRYFTIPEAPDNLIATAGDGEATISFTVPDDGGTPITNYQYSKNNGPYISFSPAVTSSPVTIPGLPNGSTYNIRLRAVNDIGYGEASASVSVTPVAGPPSGNLYTTPSTNNNVTTVAQSPFGSGYSYEFTSPSYLSISGDNSWAFGTDDFTIEWFQYQTDSNPFPRIFAIGEYPSTSIGCSIEGDDAIERTFYAWFSGGFPVGDPVPYKNEWVHFAIVRRSGTLSVYEQEFSD